jgi:hypothetical protein
MGTCASKRSQSYTVAPLPWLPAAAPTGAHATAPLASPGAHVRRPSEHARQIRIKTLRATCGAVGATARGTGGWLPKARAWSSGAETAPAAAGCTAAKRAAVAAALRSPAARRNARHPAQTSQPLQLLQSAMQTFAVVWRRLHPFNLKRHRAQAASRASQASSTSCKAVLLPGWRYEACGEWRCGRCLTVGQCRYCLRKRSAARKSNAALKLGEARRTSNHCHASRSRAAQRS